MSSAIIQMMLGLVWAEADAASTIVNMKVRATLENVPSKLLVMIGQLTFCPGISALFYDAASIKWRTDHTLYFLLFVTSLSHRCTGFVH